MTEATLKPEQATTLMNWFDATDVEIETNPFGYIIITLTPREGVNPNASLSSIERPDKLAPMEPSEEEQD